MALTTYNLDQVSATLANIPFGGAGFGEGGSISIKRNSELFENVVGRLGHVVRSRTNDKSGVVEVTLLQGDPVNDDFAELARSDEGTQNGAGVGVLLIRDRENGDEYVANEAWIQALPEVEFDKKATDRTWLVACAELDFFPGGRPAPSV